jgi:hypothetical protein
MNADIPYLKCFVRGSYISDTDILEEAYAFGIQSIPGRALGFHVMLQSGAHYRNVPIHAICTRECQERRLGDCQLWDCFSSKPVVTVFSYLRDHEAECFLRSGKVDGNYLFTVDWLPDTWERPGFTLSPEQNKCAHVLELADGNLCALPTNRMAWKDGYFVGSSPSPKGKGYTVQQDTYHAETSAWDVSKDDRYFYGPQAGPVRDV